MGVDDPAPEFDPELQALVARARAGDAGAIDPLRARLAATPGRFREIGSLAEVVRRSWLEVIAPHDPAARAALEAELAELRRELEGPHPSAMERLLVERVVLAWLQVTHGDGLIAQRREMPLENAAWLDRRNARLERRLQQAIAALAAWRRLGGDAATVVAPSGSEHDGAGERDQEPGRYPRLVAAVGRA